MLGLPLGVGIILAVGLYVLLVIGVARLMRSDD